MALGALLVLSWQLWQPGLTGGFLFDDFPNLSGLQEINEEPTLYKALQYIAGGISSQLGRPLSLVTFAVQHDSWPQCPDDFVRVNILLHLLNGLLLLWWLHRWGRLAGERSPVCSVAPLCIAALWLIAPLHTAAVLYVVQRMTLLAGTFVFAGMVLHTAGREATATGRVGRGYLLMGAGLVVGAGFGTLAKESAALFPLLLLVYEATVLRHVRTPVGWRAWVSLTMVLPVATLATYLLSHAASIGTAYEMRDFTAGERVLTEARVLCAYLWKLFVPTPYGMRLLYDDLPISRSLLDPWTTLPAILGWLALLAAALGWRKHHPAFSFGVLWFVGAHVLESSVIPLEIAFEHRNYHAAVGPLVAAAAGATALFRAPVVRRVRSAIPAGIALYALLTAVCLWQATSLWGDRSARTQYWATRQPDSVRALHDFAGLLFEQGRLDAGERVYALALQRWPEDATVPLKIAAYACLFEKVTPPSLEQLTRSVARARMTPTFIAAMDQLVGYLETGHCSRFDPADLRRVYAGALTSPGLQLGRQNLLLMNSRLAELDGDRALARRLLDDAIREGQSLALLSQGTIWALQAHDLEGAKGYLALLPRLGPVQRWTHRLEIQGLRQLITLYEEVLLPERHGPGREPAPR